MKALRLGIAVFVLCSTVVQADRAQEAARILDAAPHGSDRERSFWLYETAKQLEDGALALRIMDEVTRLAAPDAAAQARLWKVRYHMAAADTAAATAQLRLLGSVPRAATWGPEAGFWGTLLDVPAVADSSGTDLAAPPWILMRAIASIGPGELSSNAARRALALEGAARSWGQLGPWLWRLVRSGHPWLTEASEGILRAPRSSLGGSPELAEIKGWLAMQERSAQPADRAPDDVAPSAAAILAAREFAVQVGTFQDEAAARGLAAELVRHGFPAYMRITVPAEGVLHHHVRIGYGCRLAEAESLGVALMRALMLSYQIVEERRGGTDPFRAPPPIEER